MPSVPWLPVNSLHRSSPVTFLSTRPPEWIASPCPVTARMPNTWSRIAPHATRRGPERLVATTPPSVCGVRAINRGEIGRFGDDVLAMLGEHCLDLGQRRSGARRNDQLVRRIERDSGEVAGGERARRLYRPQHARLGAIADDGQGLSQRRGFADRCCDRSFVSWSEQIAQWVPPVETLRSPLTAKRQSSGACRGEPRTDRHHTPLLWPFVALARPPC